MSIKPPTFVSIVTPSFNQGRFIESSIQSVLAQDYRDIEHLVMDAGSTDGTVEILRTYSANHSQRLRFVSEKDRGQAHALNKAVGQTHGEIIGWLNSDDQFEPGAVAVAVEYFRAHPDVDLIYGDANFIDSNGRLIAQCAHVEPFDWHRLVHYSDFIVQPAAFFTRRAFNAVYGADESLNYAMDYDLFLKIAARFKVAYVPRVMANYKWFGKNKTAIGGWARLREIEKIAKGFGANGLPAYTRIEAVFLDLRLAGRAMLQARFLEMTRRVLHSVRYVIVSPRSWRSLLSPACWRVMWTGQLLRWHGA